MGPYAMIFVFSNVQFQASFFSLTIIKMLFSSSLLSAISVVSSAYLRLLIFLLALLIQAWASSKHPSAFLMMYSAYQLNKEMIIYSLDLLLSQFGTVCCAMSSSQCCFLTCIQFSQEAGKVVWFSHLSFSTDCCDSHKGFGIVNKAEVDVFLELSCFFDNSVDVGNLISGSSAFSESSLNIWNFTVHILVKPGLENFEHYFASV